MGWFSRKKKPAVVIPLDRRSPFHAVWLRQNANLPTPGMDSYAYATLGLTPTPPVGNAISVRGPGMNPAQPQQVYAAQTLTTQGVPLIAGQIFGSPLFDPNAPGNGYTDPFTGLNNVPYPRFEIAPAGEAI